MDNRDPAYRDIIEKLRDNGHDSGRPPLPPGTDGGRREPVKADWEPRVSRLEMGFCAAFVLIFAAIITSYLMLAGKIDASRDVLASVQVEQAKASAKLDLLVDRKQVVGR